MKIKTWTNRYQIRVLLVSFAFFFLVASSCKKKEDSCGCNSEVTYEVIDRGGQLRYSSETTLGASAYSIIEDSSSNLMNVYFICNSDILSTEMRDLRNQSSGSAIAVKFSGKIKRTCVQPTGNLDYIYNHIQITKVEKQ